ncbi:pantothenate kinase 4-like [Varroa destructor]|uniref:4'-phosphopantetheine phosphatase n=1 Tax=Varroa destructor TaxID=109461 RepID=A0A7M7JKR6_VARDE|nr:pantothenate kinase 4-like [Varroa destructor]XP_022647684.1 pantothenate kinase 4-like [Varroa destructor]XP_022647685.1 pantothenate kinase 4-like [Varroa destructor]XP_022647686.1 pantothenate kinase 4-like [Varroa destructor]XP_022647687.1 pantothenate kinase 4-like [Varroa destructor]
MSGQRGKQPTIQPEDDKDGFPSLRKTPLNPNAFSVPLFPNVPLSSGMNSRLHYPVPDMLSDISPPFHAGSQAPGSPSIQKPDYELPLTIAGIEKQNVKWMGLDVGGSLAKVAYFAQPPVKKPDYLQQRYLDSTLNQLHLAKFDSSKLDECLKFIRRKGLSEIHATGGGSIVNKDRMKQVLTRTCKLVLEDEVKCVVKGANFLLKKVPNEVFKKSTDSESQRCTAENSLDCVFPINEPTCDPFPYLLVHIASGVSVVKVESETQFERVGSSTLGGSSFWGLGSLLTGAEDFGELCGLVEADQRIGTTYNIERIYGSDHKNISSSLERSPGSTPKFTHLVPNAEGAPQATQIPTSVKPDTCGDDLKLEDNVSRSELAMSLLRMISSDIAQLASLYALSQEIKRVYFTGYFLRSRPMSIHLLRSALHYWSKEQVEPHFFRHEGYLGAIGALSACVDADADTDEQKHFHMASWEENYACSALPDEPLGVQSHVAFDRIDCALVICPLLATPDIYVPDREDLVENGQAREYWLTTLWKSMDSVCAKAARSWPDMPHVTTKSNVAMLRYRQIIEYLWQHPSTFGPLSVRSLLDMREQCLVQCGFVDPFMKEKKQEVTEALSLLSTLVRGLDNQDVEERWNNLTLGILQGNVFDYGAQAVVNERREAQEQNIHFGFANVRDRIQMAKCVQGSRAAWISRMKDNAAPPYRRVAIFIDNCGFDLVLGVIPFARELLKCQQTSVILCANSRPALNDVTIEELKIISPQIAVVDQLWRQAVEEGRVELVDSGQGSPCLDLTRINSYTAETLADCDLLIIEGMGRAIHTNYLLSDAYEKRTSEYLRMRTDFTCDSIRAAVLKTPFVAESLGGRIYDYVFYFTEGQVRSKEDTEVKRSTR